MSNNNLDLSLIKKAFKSVYIDDKNLDIIQADLISDLFVRDDILHLVIEFPQTMTINQKNIQDQIELVVRKNFPFIKNSKIVFSSQKIVEQPKENIQKIPNVEKIILMAATKGGVGKSTTAVNVAIAMAKAGLSIGVVDADIYGPTLPRLLGISQKPETNLGKMLPIKKYGIHSISIGYIVDEEQAAIWRGPMVSKALYQLLLGVKWPKLDYLIIDMPPGTGDVYLSLAKNFVIDGVTLVTTPQNIAFSMLKKSVNFFEKTNIPILGVIENMSYFLDGDVKYNVFGESKIRESGYKLLGEIPIISKISEFSDKGKVLSEEKEFSVYELIANEIIKV